MFDHLFIKYLCEQNVINICNCNIITAYGHITHIELTLTHI